MTINGSELLLLTLMAPSGLDEAISEKSKIHLMSRFTLRRIVPFVVLFFNQSKTSFLTSPTAPQMMRLRETVSETLVIDVHSNKKTTN